MSEMGLQRGDESAIPERGESEGGGVETANEEKLQVIGLQVGGEQFLVSILKVREIVRFFFEEVTRVPHSHAYVLGVVNLRGKVVPVVDLGLRIKISEEIGQRRKMVVVESGSQVAGFTVDAVSEVLELPLSSIEHGDGEDGLIVGVATFQGRVTSLLDLERAVRAVAPEEESP